jgi:hypothetical protein
MKKLHAFLIGAHRTWKPRCPRKLKDVRENSKGKFCYETYFTVNFSKYREIDIWISLNPGSASLK